MSKSSHKPSKMLGLREKKLAFRQDFDGTQPEISKEEQLIVAEKFQTIILDTMLQHMEYVMTYDYPEEDQSSLALELPAEDGSKLSIYIWTTYTDKRPSHTPICLSFQEIGADEYGSPLHVSYKLSEERDVVTRRDVNTKESNGFADQIPQPNLEDDSPQGIEESAVIRGAMIAALKKDAANDELAQEMGLVEQPIGLNELNMVKELLDKATPHKGY